MPITLESKWGIKNEARAFRICSEYEELVPRVASFFTDSSEANAFLATLNLTNMSSLAVPDMASSLRAPVEAMISTLTQQNLDSFLAAVKSMDPVCTDVLAVTPAPTPVSALPTPTPHQGTNEYVITGGACNGQLGIGFTSQSAALTAAGPYCHSKKLSNGLWYPVDGFAPTATPTPTPTPSPTPSPTPEPVLQPSIQQSPIYRFQL
jgi:hypothetical protein